MNQLIKRIIAFAAMVFVGVSAFAQVTTSSMNGLITDVEGEPLAGAAVIAVHTPSGTQYAAVANADGRFVINGMRTGGPYTVEVSFIGMETVEITDVMLKLGDPYELNLNMKSSETLDAVYVVSDKSFNATKTGAGDHFGHTAVETMPNVDHSIYDIIKYSPQASVTKSGSGISFAGSNNRYNSFQIDGAIANDSFGLSTTGTNGGQAGADPIALDAVEEIQIVVAPFDVRQSGFTGGAMNVITKSGTNRLKGSAYGYYSNQDLIGTTPGPIEDGKERTKYTDELIARAGFTLGGPIIKNKLFFFASGEYYKKSYPNIYTPALDAYPNYFSNTSAIGVDGAEDYQDVTFPVVVNGVTTNLNRAEFVGSKFNTTMADAIMNQYEQVYKPGEGYSESYTPHQKNEISMNALLRLDWNINTDNKLMFRYQFAHGNVDKYKSDRYTYYFNNSSYNQVNFTNSFVIELNSRLSEMVTNEARATAVFVRDRRDYPYKGACIYITGDTYTIDLGTEYSSGYNAMYSDTYTLTDNVSILAGKHNITLGTHNELFRFYNIYRQYAFGEYKYKSLADYFEGNVDEYYYNYADPELTGGSEIWGATTWAAQFGLYAQDEWKPNRNFTLTYGIRADMPVLLNKPTENPGFNEYAEGFKDTYPELYNARVGEIPAPTILLSPRVGFRWYVDDDHTAVLRGGAGLFTGRVPFVWLSNAYNNNGMEAKSVYVKGKALMDAAAEKGVNIFTSNPYDTFIKSGVLEAQNSGMTINTMNRKFKYPQVFRVNLGFDKTWDGGWTFTFDGLFSKTLNNVFFQNLAIISNNTLNPVSAEATAANPSSAAPYYTMMSSAYSTIVALSNTNKGYTYSLSGKLEKAFDFGLNLMASYTYGHAYSVNDGTSSVAYSNWKYNYCVDTNAPELSYSLFDRPHKVMGVISYNSKPYLAGRLATNISLTYMGESGQRFSYAYNETTDLNGDGYRGNSLLYIPTAEEVPQMKWAKAGDAAKFENYIRGNEYLLSHRGQWSARYAGLAPFEHHFDLHVGQDFIYNRARGSKLQLFADFMNIGNMINRNWGLDYGASSSLYVLKVTGVAKDEAGNATPTYQYDPRMITFGDFYSRWRCQLGARITF
ncbi:MAG: carboxypeptidase regulatory-like domain-containing protein [Bacteroidales bacterium]|nr:carboxypeptidase regulatory-like domain-containing protein [Bacteroidales bacterium]